jgi:hypothetical protein
MFSEGNAAQCPSSQVCQAAADSNGRLAHFFKIFNLLGLAINSCYKILVDKKTGAMQCQSADAVTDLVLRCSVY